MLLFASCFACLFVSVKRITRQPDAYEVADTKKPRRIWIIGEAAFFEAIWLFLF